LRSLAVLPNMQRLALLTFLMLALSCHAEFTAAPNGQRASVRYQGQSHL